MLEEERKIRRVVEDTFNEIFTEEQFIYLGGNISCQLSFAIANDYTIICEFMVSEYGVFSAKSHEQLLDSPYYVKQWLDFITKVKDRLLKEE